MSKAVKNILGIAGILALAAVAIAAAVFALGAPQAPATATPTLSVEEQVQATLTAMAPEQVAEGTTIPSVPSGTPEAPLPTPTPTPTGTPVPAGEVPACRDGELVVVHAADTGDVLARLPVGEAERVDILEISWQGEGFGGLDRAIIVIPRLGNVWQVNVRPGAQTVATRGFCGSNEAVADWAVTAHVPSLQQASRDANGDQPTMDEIGVYILNYEERTLSVVKEAPDGPSPEEVLTHIELSFHEDGNISNVPMHVETP